MDRSYNEENLEKLREKLEKSDSIRDLTVNISTIVSQGGLLLNDTDENIRKPYTVTLLKQHLRRIQENGSSDSSYVKDIEGWDESISRLPDDIIYEIGELRI